MHVYVQVQWEGLHKVALADCTIIPFKVHHIVMASQSEETASDRFDIANIIRLIKQGEAVDNVLKVIADSDPEKLTEVKPDGTSLLHSFAIVGSYDLVKALWNKGARPSILQMDRSTILHSAVRTQDESQDEGRAQILQLFLSSEKHGSDLKASVNLQNNKGWTTLKLAARRNLERSVEVLLESGADPDIPDEEKFTALHNAIGFPAIVKLLLTKAKNINSQNNDGETPLYLAAERGLTESALTLLEYEADPNIPNKEGNLLVLQHLCTPLIRLLNFRDFPSVPGCKRWAPGTR